MQKIQIGENERGLLFCSGKFKKLLGTGSYFVGGNRSIVVLNLESEFILPNGGESRLIGNNEELSNSLETVAVPDNSIAFHYVDSVYKGYLLKGFHAFWKDVGEHSFKLYDMTKDVPSELNGWLQRMLDVNRGGESKELSDLLETITISDNFVAIHYVDGVYNGYLLKGFHAFWKDVGKHSFKLYDMSKEVPSEIESWLLRILTFNNICQREYVANAYKGKLFVDGKFERLLGPGTYYFWKSGKEIKVEQIDTRLRLLQLMGQEMLTADRVTIRINFVCRYRVTDYIKINAEIDSFEEQFRSSIQLVLREYVGSKKLDEILNARGELDKMIFEELKKKEKDFYIEIVDSGIKDIILPGEIREIMNTVLVAEKQAQANVIARREEVASTRSLLNTAKLLEENETLRRLKEYEYIEKICKNVSSVNISGSGDILSQLADILKTKK